MNTQVKGQGYEAVISATALYLSKCDDVVWGEPGSEHQCFMSLSLHAEGEQTGSWVRTCFEWDCVRHPRIGSWDTQRLEMFFRLQLWSWW